MTLDGIKDLILGEEMRRKKQAGNSSEVLLVVKERGVDWNSGSRGSSSGTREVVRCWSCNEVGHFWSQCLKSKKDLIANAEGGDYYDESMPSVESNVDSWVGDSGASFQGMDSGETITNLEQGNFERVQLSYDQVLDATSMGIGNLVIARGIKQGSVDMVHVTSEESATLGKTSSKVVLAESGKTKRVQFASLNPGVCMMSANCIRKSESVRGSRNSGSMVRVPNTIPKLRWVRKTGNSNGEISPGNSLLNLESEYSLCISESGVLSKPVEIGNGSSTELVTTESGKTAELELDGASTASSVD